MFTEWLMADARTGTGRRQNLYRFFSEPGHCSPTAGHGHNNGLLPLIKGNEIEFLFVVDPGKDR
jgi:hypothetical protein